MLLIGDVLVSNKAYRLEPIPDKWEEIDNFWNKVKSLSALKGITIKKLIFNLLAEAIRKEKLS